MKDNFALNTDFINHLRFVVNSCIYIFQALPELDITDVEVKKALVYVARRCNELYERELDDVLNFPDDGKQSL